MNEKEEDVSQVLIELLLIGTIIIDTRSGDSAKVKDA